MRTLAIIAATMITVAASHAQDPVERTWGAGGKPALKAPGSFPTSDPRSPVCEENASGGGSCDYKLAPVRTIEDSASISCGSDANVGLVIDSTLICSDDGGNKRRLAVRGVGRPCLGA